MKNRINNQSPPIRLSDEHVLDVLMPIGDDNKALPLINGFNACNNAGYDDKTQPKTGKAKNDDLWAMQHSINSMYKLEGNNLIILHNPIRSRAEDFEQRIRKAQDDALANLPADKKASVTISHVIPEIGYGRLKRVTGGKFGGDHICLRVVQGKNPKKTDGVLIDPRDVAQSTFNDTDCGRYVTTMAGAAVGMISNGIKVTANSLKNSPIVRDAAEFRTVEQLKIATKCVAENPADHDLQQEVLNQIRQLNATYEARQKDGSQNYKTRFGKLFGYSAEEKQNAAKAILKKFNPNDPTGKFGLSDKDFKAANQGRLKEQFKKLQKTSYIGTDVQEDTTKKNDKPLTP